MALSAPAVSAKLKEAGFGIVHTRDREGIRVSRGALAGRVCVSVDLDRPSEGLRATAQLLHWLEQNAPALGWDWRQHSGDVHQYTITHKAPEDVGAHRDKDQEAVKLSSEVRVAMSQLHTAIYNDTAPAQAHITAARTALEALITLAGGE